jgi:hypothetical protein
MSETINTTLNWSQLNEEWESSGLSQVNFCKQKEINLAHFTYQRSKILKKRIYKKSSEFASVKLTTLKLIAPIILLSVHILSIKLFFWIILL